jgi:hypothetical protein
MGEVHKRIRGLREGKFKKREKFICPILSELHSLALMQKISKYSSPDHKKIG